MSPSILVCTALLKTFDAPVESFCTHPTQRSVAWLRQTTSVDIRKVGRGDEDLVISAAHLFDGPADELATREFLNKDDHHILIAYEEEHPAGFITGVEVTHPDKGTEMFIYELAVEEDFQRRGLGEALVMELASVAREKGCYGMWVLTDEENAAALATYAKSGGAVESRSTMISWTF
jgi:ribosomal protein S18 acetylase RimI-like enzyme